MEYEKKYNNLIARINEVKEKPSLCMKDKHHYNGYVETGIRDALDYIVSPESEDKGIRKEIIEFIDWAESRGSVRNDWHQKKRPAEWIAYLEKQKEQKPAEWSEEGYVRVYEPRPGTIIDKAISDAIEEARKIGKCLILRFNGVCLSIEKNSNPDTLKSMYYRRWKPSEEQMGALNYAYCELFKRGDVGHNILGPFQSLIDTLRKL